MEQPTVRYLSDEWLDAADAAVADLPPGAAATVGFVVTGGPHGERSYELVLGGDRVGVRQLSEPDVTMTMSWEVASSIARGRRGAQKAVLDGEIAMSGDARVLLGRAGELGSIDDAFADLRARTTFD